MSSRNEMTDGSTEDRLERLFAAYRESCPDPEPGARFMPQLWQRIDARRSFSFRMKRFAQGIITVAAAASLMMGFYLQRPASSVSPSYLELLAAGGPAHENLADAEIVQALHDNSR